MPESLPSGLDERRRKLARRIVVVFAAVLAVALLVWLGTGQGKIHEGPSEKPLPRSLEEFRVVLKQPDFGMYFTDYSGVLARPKTELTPDGVKRSVKDLLGYRLGSMGSIESLGRLVTTYSAVARKRVSYGRSWLSVTNEISYVDSFRKTRRDTLAEIEGILRTNGAYIFPLNSSNLVLLTEEDLKALGHWTSLDGG